MRPSVTMRNPDLDLPLGVTVVDMAMAMVVVDMAMAMVVVDTTDANKTEPSLL